MKNVTIKLLKFIQLYLISAHKVSASKQQYIGSTLQNCSLGGPELKCKLQGILLT